MRFIDDPRFMLFRDISLDGDGGGDSDTSSPSEGLENFDAPIHAADPNGLEKTSDGDRPPDFEFFNKKREKPEPKPEEVEEESEAPVDEKKPEPKKEQKKEATKAEKTSEKPEKVEEKKDEKEEYKIPSEEDIDALQPKKGAPAHVYENFKKLKDEVLKPLRREAVAYRQQVEELKTQVSTLEQEKGKLTPEVEEELKGLRGLRYMMKAQEDPVFQKQFEEPIGKAADKVYAVLKQFGLPDDALKSIQEVAEQNGGNLEAWPHWEKLLNTETNPLNRQTIIDALKGRRDAIGARDAQLAKVSQDREEYFKNIAEKENADRSKWARDLQTAAEIISQGEEWAAEKEVPAGASAEVKKAVEAHNARVGEIAKGFQTRVLGAYNRDPKMIAELAFSSVKADELQRQLDEAETQREKDSARIKDLETKLSKIKSAGRVTHSESPDPAPRNKSTVDEGKVGGDGNAAFDKFFKR